MDFRIKKLRVPKKITEQFKHRFKDFCNEGYNVVTDIVVEEKWLQNRVYIILIGDEEDIKSVLNHIKTVKKEVS